MKTKTIILTALLLVAAMGAKAQVDVTKVDATHYTFTMPAYDVEVTTELWYKLSETASDNKANYGDKTNVFLERTLQAGGWNTFCAPFAIADPEEVFGEGVKVMAFTGATLAGDMLTLNFSEAATIVAATPYLIKLPGESSVNLAADGKEFEGVSQVWTPVDVNPNSGLVTFKAVLTPLEITPPDDEKLFVSGGNSLAFASVHGTIHNFRAYFELDDSSSAPTAFRMDFGEEVITGIINVEASQEMRQTGIYTIDGRKLDRLPNHPGVYIVNGQKVINY